MKLAPARVDAAGDRARVTRSWRETRRPRVLRSAGVRQRARFKTHGRAAVRVLPGVMGAALLGVWAAAGTCGSPATVAFDVHMVAAGAQTFRLTAPNGKRLVVVDDDVTISEIPGVEATLTRVDDVSQDSAGPASVEVEMSHPASGTWRAEMSVQRLAGISLTATAEAGSICEA